MKNNLLFLFLCFFSLTAYAQNSNPRWSIAGNTAAEAPATKRLGTMSAGVPLNIYSGGTQRAIFNGATGFFGVGFLTPAYRLDVQDNINVNTTGFVNGFRINGFTVLQTPGVENTFVGRGAGVNTVLTPFAQNTFVGFQAGGSNINGDRNTFIGRAAGYANVNGRFNTFIGCDAGLNLVTGNENTFVGEHAGYRQVSGDNNVFVGGHSGQSPALGGTGSDNTFLGTYCGPNDLSGDGNTFSGYRAGNNCNRVTEIVFMENSQDFPL